MKKFIKFAFIFSIITVMLLFAVACGEKPNDNFHKENITLEVGDSYFAQANEGTWSEYVYSSSDETVATVSSKGVITAVKEGTSVITAKRGEVTVYEITVTVVASTYVAPPVVDNTSYRIVLNSYESVLYLGGSYDLNVSVYKNDTLVNEKPTFAITGESVEIEPAVDGVKVKAKAVGASTVTFKIGGFEATYVVNVYETSVQYLSVPTITKANATELSWNAVANAGSYRVSLNNGTDWTETTQTSYAITGEYNPLQVRIQALPTNGTNYAKSNSAILSASNLMIDNGKDIKVLFNKTVAGNDNDIKVNVELKLFFAYAGEKFQIADKYVSWSVDNQEVVSLNQKTLSAVKLGSTKVFAKIMGGQAISNVVVGIPVSSKADLDALAFGQRDGDNTIWHAGKIYILSNDIDYMSENWHERYLAPIAIEISGWGDSAPRPGLADFKFGIYGSRMNLLGADHKDPQGKISNGAFYATLDGDGHAIKNAIIPCGTIVGTMGTNKVVGYNGFIGRMWQGSSLKNIAFLNLTFETPAQAAANPYMYNVATNPNLAETDFATTGIDIANYSNAFSFRTALIGEMSETTIENVYVETVAPYGTWHPSCPNGILVGKIKPDSATGPKNEIKGCVVKATYAKTAFLNYGFGVGAIAGINSTQSSETITDCFVITQADTNNNAFNDRRLFINIDDPRITQVGISGLEKYTSATTNTAVYGTKADLLAAQGALANKYDIWNRIA